MRKLLLAIFALGFAVALAQGTPTLTIWWNKGYYPEEDEALKRVVAEWEKESGYKVDLSFYSTEDIPKKVLSAVEAGQPPDIAFSHFADWQLNPKLAWEGKLEDVSDIVAPIKDKYTQGALQSVFLYNNVKKKRSYYAVPIEQQTIHIHYWQDLVAQAGLDEASIPKIWDGFWDYWKRAQKNLRRKGKRIYGLGLPMSTGASDTYFVFEQILAAYGAELLDNNGELQIDQPAVREKIIKALDFYTSFYRQHYVPPGAVNWLDPDNNVNFLNHTTVMTPNPTLSIPASQRSKPDVYYKEIATVEWPDRPDGTPITYLVSVKSATIFANSRHKEAAKSFLRFLIQPKHLGDYIKGSLGRWFPVMPDLLKDPFWTDPKDPHISVAVRQFTRRPTRPFYQVFNPAYSQVNAENVWGKAIGRVVVDGWSPAKAADEAIARIEQIFSGWR